jgi:hypothetical protein
MADGVQVDRRGLVRQLRSSGGDGAVFVRFRTGGDRHAAMDAIAAASQVAVAATNAPGVPDEHAIVVHPSAVTPHGPVVFIASCDTIEALETWLSVVAAELTAAEWEGRLIPIRPVDTPYEEAGGRVECVSLGLVLPVDHGEWDAAWRQRLRQEELWLVEAAATQTAIERAAAFWLGVEGDHYFSHGVMQFDVDADDASSLLDGVRGRLPSTILTTAGRDATAHRVVFGIGGHVIYDLHPADGDWLAAVRPLTELLRAHAAIAEYGLIRQSWTPTYMWDDLHDRRPPRLPYARVSYSRNTRHLESSYVPDAYGVQLLSEAHLARAADLSRWQVTELGDGRYLVTAADLDAWFNHDQPAENLLEQARRDFGPLILRREYVRQARAARSGRG